MDYSIGSLSDLITGSNTPNKKKVVKKQFSPKKKLLSPPKQQNDSPNSNNGEVHEERPSFQKKKKAHKIIKEVIDNNSEQPVSVKKLNKKRKLSSTDENEPIIKKSKNSVNAERRMKLKEKAEKPEEDPELLAKTVFVGNVPVSSSTKKLKRFFTKYGKIETVRIRGVPVADPKTPKKVAIIKKEFHPERKSFFAFIRFEDREDAIKATEANGVLYQDHHLRVHLCTSEEKPDENKAIFVGNLSFYAEEDDLWKTFESCGPISSVRIVRDGRTGMGKGFGYVNFKNSDSVTLALEMEDVKLKERELRISICNVNAAKKNKKNNKVKKISKPGKPKIRKQKELKENQDDKEKSTTPVNESFQGAKFVQKKKKKFNKGLLQKKKMVKQIAPK